MDSKAEYSALSSTRSQKLKQTKQGPFNSVQVKIREVSPEGIGVTMEERICERDNNDLLSMCCSSNHKTKKINFVSSQILK